MAKKSNHMFTFHNAVCVDNISLRNSFADSFNEIYNSLTLLSSEDRDMYRVWDMCFEDKKYVKFLYKTATN